MAEERRRPIVTTKTGDDGYTRVLGPDRLPKHDPRVEALGDVDEATSALGLARAVSNDEFVGGVIKSIQQDLYVVMSELAAGPERAAKLPKRISAEDVARLESLVRDLQSRTVIPVAFVLPGESMAGAALDLARTVVRRAERRIARLAHDGSVANDDVLRYANRLSDLVFVLARHVEGGTSPTVT